MLKGMVATVGGLLASAGLLCAQAPVASQVPASPAPKAGAPLVLPTPREPAPAPGADPAPWYSSYVPDIWGGAAGAPGGDWVWASADYLLWWVRKAPIPLPLITTGSINDAVPGALGQANTQVLFGDESRGFNAFSGGRFNVGMWLMGGDVGIEGGGFALAQQSFTVAFKSDGAGNPLITVPIFNTAPGQGENSYFYAVPDPVFANGGVAAIYHLRFDGADVNGVFKAYSDSQSRLTLLVGARYVDLTEDLQLDAAGTPFFASPPSPPTFQFLGAPVNPPNTLFNFDDFHTINHFYGGQVGARWQYQRGIFSAEVLAKVAVGVDDEQLIIKGGTAVIAPGGTILGTAPGGIFAQTTNIGSHTQDRFAVLPEVGVIFGVRLTPQLVARVGYTFIYCSDVLRPGNQIDRNIDVFNVPHDPAFGTGTTAPTRPTVIFKSTEFTASGLSAGLEFSY